jgi:parallel beta-helix repeat protein
MDMRWIKGGVFGKMDRKHGIFLIGAVLLVFCAFVGSVSAATTWYVDDDGGADFTTIQDAVDAATAGDTIIVRDGTYAGARVNSSHLTLRSENGAAHCIINGGFYASAIDMPFGGFDHISISGFTVTGGGIDLECSNYGTIENNIITDCGTGIFLWYESNHNTITNNIISNNDVGIRLDMSQGGATGNSITNNVVSPNNNAGIVISTGYCDTTVADNTVSGGISVLDSCWRNIITDNIILSSGEFYGSGASSILIMRSDENTIKNNVISNDEGIGISLCLDSSGNLIYNNNFNDMTAEDYSEGPEPENIWNIEKTAGTNIIGGPYLGGNYWGDYAGTDEDGDGLGDTQLPYNSNGHIGIGGDYHPLVEYVPNNPPDEPSNPSPSNHAIDQSIDVDLSWTGGDPDTGDTVTYDVYFGTSSSPSKVKDDQSGTSYDPGTLSYGTTYYWKIKATDNNGASTSGPVWDFTTGAASNKPPDTVITSRPLGNHQL